MKIEFPDPRHTNEDGLLVIGGDLSLENLVNAYSIGVFPWPQAGLPILWFSPLERGVLDFDEFRIPDRLNRYLKKCDFSFSRNQKFEYVIDECSKIPRKNETGTWIIPELKDAYMNLHKNGYAHSIECWQGGEIVGGLYGVFINGAFSGESMFHKVDHASKACLIHLVEFLKGSGLKWLDIQMVTPVVESFGGKYISREDFLKRLEGVESKQIEFSLKP